MPYCQICKMDILDMDPTNLVCASCAPVTEDGSVHVWRNSVAQVIAETFRHRWQGGLVELAETTSGCPLITLRAEGTPTINITVTNAREPKR